MNSQHVSVTLIAFGSATLRGLVMFQAVLVDLVRSMFILPYLLCFAFYIVFRLFVSYDITFHDGFGLSYSSELFFFLLICRKFPLGSSGLHLPRGEGTMGMTETTIKATGMLVQRHGVLDVVATTIVTKLIISQGKNGPIGNGGRRIGMNHPRILLTILKTVLFAQIIHKMLMGMLLIAYTDCHRG